jgi:hypothetical protein
MPLDAPSQPVSADVAAVLRLVEVLDQLDDAARERVLHFVQSHYQRPARSGAVGSSPLPATPNDALR